MKAESRARTGKGESDEGEGTAGCGLGGRAHGDSSRPHFKGDWKTVDGEGRNEVGDAITGK